MNEERQVIKPKDAGSLEDALGPGDPLFRPEPKGQAPNESEQLENFVAFNVAVQKKVEAARTEGYVEALRLYAWWKDGVQYVGTRGKTLTQALEDMDK